jgi:hypothetical protein
MIQGIFRALFKRHRRESDSTPSRHSSARRLVAICYNGNSLFLLGRFAGARAAPLHCYVPPSLQPLATHLGIATRPLRYGALILDLLKGLLLLRAPILVLPHTGGRFLRILRRVYQVDLFVDDGFLCLGFDQFLRSSDTVITFADIEDYRRGDELTFACTCPATLADYARAFMSVPAPRLERPTHVIVSSSELDDAALQCLVDQPPIGVDLRHIPHPRSYKNKAVFSDLQAITPMVAYGADAVILHNLDRITGLTIGRSFTSYLLAAWLTTQGRGEILEIHRPDGCTRNFVELHHFCTWLSKDRTA